MSVGGCFDCYLIKEISVQCGAASFLGTGVAGSGALESRLMTVDKEGCVYLFALDFGWMARKRCVGWLLLLELQSQAGLQGDSFREPAINALVSWGLFGIEL